MSSRDRRRLVPPSVMGRLGVAVLAASMAGGPLLSASWAQAAGPASEEEAAPADPMLEQAMQAYKRGTDNYNHAQYEAALADFKEAASLYASADFQYNIGLCYEKLGKYDEAIRAFATYLRAKPDAADRPNVENRIKELEQRLNEEKERKEAEEAEAARRREDAGQQPIVIVQPAEDEPDPNEGRGMVIAGAALLGVGGAVALGGGIGFGIAAGQRSAAVDEVQTGGNPDELGFGETQTLEDEGKRLEALQIGLAAGGAAIAVTGGVLLALGLKKRKTIRASAMLGPSTAGLVIGGRF